MALTPTTTLVSVNHAGSASGNADSYILPPFIAGRPDAITPNGRYVLFASYASDLAPTPKGNTTACAPNGFFSGSTCPNVFVRDLKRNTTTLVSVNGAGSASANSFSEPDGITANARFVLFGSLASDLVAGDTNGSPDVFVRDLKSNTTTLVSVDVAGTGSGNSGSTAFDGGGISSDGRIVLFTSTASNLVADDTNGAADVFVRDLKHGTTILMSVNSAGTASGNAVPFGITPNGQRVLFQSFSQLLADDTNGASDVFVRRWR